MNIPNIAELGRRPEPFSTSARSIWTDPWIQERLLAAHLDESHDAASRRRPQRERALAWIAGLLPPGPARVLDLGCGPGLYAEALAAAGHRVRGLDLSAASVRSARERAAAAGLEIDYRVGNYLRDDLGSGWDLAMVVYCDYGALAPGDARLLLRRARGSLAPGGLLVLDFFGASYAASKRASRDWGAAPGKGFWSQKPHLVLEETIAYPELKAFASQTIVLAEGEEPALYRTWDRWFEPEEMAAELAAAGFEAAEFREDLVEAGDFAPGATFVAARRTGD